MIVYKKDNVLIAAQKRISKVFDEFENIQVSISSGKDSTVLYYLVLNEAIKRKRKIYVFFLDQELEYNSTVKLIENMMIHPNVIPKWYQVDVKMTNSTSNKDYFLNAWGVGEQWVREKHPIAVHSIDGKYSDRFYTFFDWYDQQKIKKTASFIGLRSKESLHRFRAVTKYPGYKNILWSTKTKNEKVFKFYPIYDWCFPDVWKYIDDNNIKYNKIYDMMFMQDGVNITNMRVSNLIHEKSFKCLTSLQEFEPETYDKILKRVNGIHCAALYAKDDYIYSVKKLPKKFKTWLEYRNYLLRTTPIDKIDVFIKRFKKQIKHEEVYKQQCKQILINDWENNMPVNQKKIKKNEELKKKWYDLL